MVLNTHVSFGSVAKAFHWVGAALIFAMIGLGLWAVKAPLETPEQMAAKWQLFALHKTVGVCAFGFGLLRLMSMAFQVKPAPLAGHRKTEVYAARTVHWMLSLLMILVPLAGWIRHASLPGFAPLYLPFGDSLPFVPADPNLSEIASYMHFGFVLLLVGAVVLHVMGALKHHVIDGDATLKRMLPGRAKATDTQPAAASLGPLACALVLIAAVAGIAISSVPAP
jgi:cytochrome b561